MAETRRIGRGERAPDFGLPLAPSGTTTRFYGLVGGAPSVLVLAGERSAAAAVSALRQRLPETVVHAVSVAEPDGAEATFHDPGGDVHGAYGAPLQEVTVLLLDRGVRVAGVSAAASADDLDLDAVADAAAGLAGEEPPVEAQRQAPVLLVPDALDGALCDELVGVYEAADPVPTGVETMADGRRTEALDHLRKQRRDHVVEDPELLRRLTAHVGRRIVPEVAKAFAYTATRFEGFKLGAYDATDAGFFAAHRDNLSPTTAHRRFALSINLDDDHEGGQLRFPEYGPHLFAPARGEALVFSGAHLHEVLPVTRGRRHVLLSFLYGDQPRRS